MYSAAAIDPAISANGNGNFHLDFVVIERAIVIEQYPYSFIDRLNTSALDSTWESLRPLEVNLCNYVAIEMDGKFYVAGQIEPSAVHIYCYEYDTDIPENPPKTWVYKAEIFDVPPISSLAKLGGLLYFIFDDGTAYSYDPERNDGQRVNFMIVCIFPFVQTSSILQCGMYIVHFRLDVFRPQRKSCKLLIMAETSMRCTGRKRQRMWELAKSDFRRNASSSNQLMWYSTLGKWAYCSLNAAHALTERSKLEWTIARDRIRLSFITFIISILYCIKMGQRWTEWVSTYWIETCNRSFIFINMLKSSQCHNVATFSYFLSLMHDATTYNVSSYRFTLIANVLKTFSNQRVLKWVKRVCGMTFNMYYSICWKWLSIGTIHPSMHLK